MKTKPLALAALVLACLAATDPARADFLVSVSNTAGTANRLDRFTDAGVYVGPFVTEGLGGLISPQGLAYGLDHNLYVASFTDGTIKEYNGLTGSLINAAFASNAQMVQSVVGLKVGPNGDLYVSNFNS